LLQHTAETVKATKENAMLKVIAAIVLIPFSILSAAVFWQLGLWNGYWAIWQAGLKDLPSMQLLADLVIACSLGAMWIWHDAKQKARNPWPYIAIVFAAGSLGILFYLLLAPRKQPTAIARQGAAA
jgi:hypothetical protein